MAMSDLEVRAHQGDPAAFAALLRDWDHDLRGVVWSVVRNANTTDQVMQVAYDTAFASIDRFDDQASMKTWLHTICLRTAIDQTRAAPPDIDNSASADTELDAAFDSLDGVERLLIMLTVGVGASFDEAATIVGMPRATVADKVARARDRLDARRTEVADD